MLFASTETSTLPSATSGTPHANEVATPTVIPKESDQLGGLLQGFRTLDGGCLLRLSRVAHRLPVQLRGARLEYLGRRDVVLNLLDLEVSHRVGVHGAPHTAVVVVKAGPSVDAEVPVILDDGEVSALAGGLHGAPHTAVVVAGARPSVNAEVPVALLDGEVLPYARGLRGAPHTAVVVVGASPMIDAEVPVTLLDGKEQALRRLYVVIHTQELTDTYHGTRLQSHNATFPSCLPKQPG